MSAANLESVLSSESRTSGPKSSADVSRNVRRKYFVSSLLQGKLIGRMVGYWFVYHVVLWHTMFLYRWMRHGGEMLAGGRPRTFLDLYTEFAAYHYSLIVCALAILPLILWDGVRTTHRVAGPIVRFRNAFAALARGETVAPIKLRDDDLMHELEDAFNEYLATCPRVTRPSTATVAAPEVDDSSNPTEADDRLGDEVLEELIGSGTVDEDSGEWPGDGAGKRTTVPPQPARV